MSKEFNIGEINVEIIDSNSEQSLIQLSELTFLLVGGGDATVNF